MPRPPDHPEAWAGCIESRVVRSQNSGVGRLLLDRPVGTHAYRAFFFAVSSRTSICGRRHDRHETLKRY